MINRRKTISWILLVVIAVIACGCSLLSKKKSDDEGTPDSAEETVFDDCDGKECRSIPFALTLRSEKTFEAFASKDFILGISGMSVKFFIDARKKPVAYYMNGNFKIDGAVPTSAELHYKFAQAYLQIPEDAMNYDQMTYYTNKKQYFAGSIQRYHLESTGEEVYGIQYFPQDVISEETILTSIEILRQTFNMRDHKVVFVATGEQQTAATIAAKLKEYDIRALSMDDVLGAQMFLAMNLGEAIGYLRVFPQNQDDLKPTDIAVFDKLPLDLAVVSGVITKAYQDPNSHVNLKSRERQTPNMVLRDASRTNALLAKFADKPVRLVVKADGFDILPSTDQEIKSWFDALMARPWVAMRHGSDERILSYDEMCPVDPSMCLGLSESFGGKAANLGFLAHPNVLGRTSNPGSLSAQLEYDLSPHGFGVSLAFYDLLVNAAENAPLKAQIDELIAAEMKGDVSMTERRQRAAKIRDLLLAAKVPEILSNAVRARVGELLPTTTKIKVRSSANAEDISGFNGAGLYDSYKADVRLPVDSTLPCVIVEKTVKNGSVRERLAPETIECAIKAVYASLWNPRAVSERSFMRLDHRTAAMGLAIVPAYNGASKIDANSVLITRIVNTDTLWGYAISTQNGNNLVTRPAPDTYSELAIAVMLTEGTPTSLTVTRLAKSKPDKDPRTKAVLSREKMLTMIEIAKTTELAYCRSNLQYYLLGHANRQCEFALFDQKKPKALDFEFKLLKNGQFICKQVREFVER